MGGALFGSRNMLPAVAVFMLCTGMRAALLTFPSHETGTGPQSNTAETKSRVPLSLRSPRLPSSTMDDLHPSLYSSPYCSQGEVGEFGGTTVRLCIAT